MRRPQAARASGGTAAATGATLQAASISCPASAAAGPCRPERASIASAVSRSRALSRTRSSGPGSKAASVALRFIVVSKRGM
jgi:hypothetical protein